MIEKYTLPLNQIDNLRPVAEDLSNLLRLPANADIIKEFPHTVKYTGDREYVLQNLLETREKFVAGKREDFILFAGKVAVGMSQVATPGCAFLDIDPECPILSGFVGHDYRRQGFGRLSMKTRLNVVDQRFGGYAMTMVKHDNVASIGLVRSSGFILTSSNTISGTYAYSNQR